jgi:hypothetical protein
MFIDARVFLSERSFASPLARLQHIPYPAHSVHRGNNSAEGVDLSTPAAEEFGVGWS